MNTETHEQRPPDINSLLRTVVKENCSALLLTPNAFPCIVLNDEMHEVHSRVLSYYDLEKIFAEVTPGPPPKNKRVSGYRKALSTSNDLYALSPECRFNVATLFDSSRQVELILFMVLPGEKPDSAGPPMGSDAATPSENDASGDE